MTSIALIASELPVHLLSQVSDRIHDRFGQSEVRFAWWQDPALLPVRWDGALRLLQWGNKVRRSRLPHGGFLTLEQFEGGIVTGVEEAVIPASYGFHRGSWYLIEEGIRGIVVPEAPLVYVLLEHASNYYRNMTGQSPWMPVFVNQVI